MSVITAVQLYKEKPHGLYIVTVCRDYMLLHWIASVLMYFGTFVSLLQTSNELIFIDITIQKWNCIGRSIEFRLIVFHISVASWQYLKDICLWWRKYNIYQTSWPMPTTLGVNCPLFFDFIYEYYYFQLKFLINHNKIWPMSFLDNVLSVSERIYRIRSLFPEITA